MKATDTNKYKQDLSTLEKIQSKNFRSARISDIKYSFLYRDDFKYRLLYNSINFINIHYHPLKFLVPSLLNIFEQDYPNNPYACEMHIGNNYQKLLSSSNSIQMVDELSKKYKNFPPLLALITKFYLAIGQNKKALSTIDRLLDIYPAYPHWLYWEQVRTRIRLNNGKA